MRRGAGYFKPAPLRMSAWRLEAPARSASDDLDHRSDVDATESGLRGARVIVADKANVGEAGRLEGVYRSELRIVQVDEDRKAAGASPPKEPTRPSGLDVVIQVELAGGSQLGSGNGAGVARYRGSRGRLRC